MDNRHVYNLNSVWGRFFEEFDSTEPEYSTTEKSPNRVRHPFYNWIEEKYNFEWIGGTKVVFNTNKDALDFILKNEGVTRV